MFTLYNRMWSPELPWHVFPKIATACGSPELSWHVVPTTAIRMWSPKLTSHLIPRNDLNQIQVTIITVDEGIGPSVVQSADSYRLFEPVPLSRQWFPFPPFSPGYIIGS